MQASQTTMQDADKGTKPAWLAPVVVLVVIGGLVAIGNKKSEAVENPIVDLGIITVGVFAFAAVFRFLAGKLGSPGMASFFGGDTAAPVNP